MRFGLNAQAHERVSVCIEEGRSDPREALIVKLWVKLVISTSTFVRIHTSGVVAHLPLGHVAEQLRGRP